MSEPNLDDNIVSIRYLTKEELEAGTAIPAPGSAYPSGAAWWEGGGDCIEGPADPEWDYGDTDALIRGAGA